MPRKARRTGSAADGEVSFKWTKLAVKSGGSKGRRIDGIPMLVSINSCRLACRGPSPDLPRHGGNASQKVTAAKASLPPPFLLFDAAFDCAIRARRTRSGPEGYRTTTLVPMPTRSYRSLTSSLRMRMHPDDTARPIDDGRFDP